MLIQLLIIYLGVGFLLGLIYLEVELGGGTFNLKSFCKMLLFIIGWLPYVLTFQPPK